MRLDLRRCADFFDLSAFYQHGRGRKHFAGAGIEHPSSFDQSDGSGRLSRKNAGKQKGEVRCSYRQEDSIWFHVRVLPYLSNFTAPRLRAADRDRCPKSGPGYPTTRGVRHGSKNTRKERGAE
jgi:hypothetical protein